MARSERASSPQGLQLTLATISFAVCFTAWGLISAFAPKFRELFHLTASETALLVSVLVLLGSLARLPMGIFADRFGGRVVFAVLALLVAVPVALVPSVASYRQLLVVGFFLGLAGSSFAVGVAFTSPWFPPARQGGALGVYYGITYDRIDQEQGVFWPCPSAGHFGTPRLFEGGVSTHADSRSRFLPTPWRESGDPVDADFALYLTTGRVVSQYLSGTQTRRIGALVEQYPEPLVEIHPRLAGTLNIVPGDWITVTTRRAEIVDGAPGLGDVTAFLTNLEAAITATLGDTAKREAFKTRAQASEADLEELARIRDGLGTQWNAHWPPMNPAGPGRVDAFGLIFNRVLAYDIDAPDNARMVDAPVSYPFLWNTPQHDRVQWNGTAQNRLPFGLGPLMRNVGEVLGVFAHLTITKGLNPRTHTTYESTIRKGDLVFLENALGTLRPPAWPVGCAGINMALLGPGQRVYDKECQTCHRALDRKDTRTRFNAKMVSVFDVGTDLTMATNSANGYQLSQLETGVLHGEAKFFNPVSKFGETETGLQMLVHLVLESIFGETADVAEAGRHDIPRTTAESEARKVLLEIAKANLEYKARPLTGVWATAPFLHNGSVPNIEELLKPSSERAAQFYVGNPAFDVERIGLSTEKAPGSVLFDTTKPGNSSAGHEYGTTLSANNKRALLEYLKVIGQKVR